MKGFILLSQCTLLIALMSGLAFGSHQADLVQSTTITQQETIHRIKTLSVNIQRQIKSEKSNQTEVGKYHRNGSTVRISDGKPGSRVNDILVKDGVTKQVAQTWRNQKANYGLFLRASNKPLMSQFNLYQELAFEVYDPTSQRMRSFSDFFSQPGVVTGSASVTLDGRKCVRIDCDMLPAQPNKAKMSYWFDLGYGCLAVKIVYEESFGESPVTVEKRLSEFVEYEPGVYLPSSVFELTTKMGQTLETTNLKLSDIKINQQINESVFTLPTIPSGTRLQNDISGKLEEVDSDWRPLKPGVPLKPQSTIQPLPTQPTTSTGPSKTEEASWLTYAAYVFVALFIITGMLSLIVYYRRKNVSNIA